MSLISYENLPSFMKNKKVKKYYDILKKKKLYLSLKRIFDFYAGTALAVVFALPMGVIAYKIKKSSKGHILFVQDRITKYGKKFPIYKFRTMTEGAHKGSALTVGQDSRITEIGETLRKYRLDEIPQLFNIIGGDMSFVGTRPEVEKYVKHYTDEMKATLLMPAGLTSRASIAYKDEARLLDGATDPDAVYINRVLPEKMKYNLEGIEKASFKEDLYVLAKTIFAVMK